MTTLDKLILNKYHANEDDEQNSDPDCCYIGHLKNEPEACVAMTGKGTKILGWSRYMSLRLSSLYFEGS